jgi:lysozyme
MSPNKKTSAALLLSIFVAFLLLTQRGKNLAAQIGNTVMELSDSGLKLIADIETFSPFPYPDADGQSVGFGHFILPTDQFSFPITEDFGYQLLHLDATSANATVNQYVNVPLSQDQHDALVSFVYNIGAGNFINSTLLRLLNKGDYTGAANQFPVWNKEHLNGALVVSQALVNRRAQEQTLFLT